MFPAFQALLQIKALEPLPAGTLLDDDTITGDPRVGSTVVAMMGMITIVCVGSMLLQAIRVCLYFKL